MKGGRLIVAGTIVCNTQIDEKYNTNYSLQ